MKSLNEIKSEFEHKSFDLAFETGMVQSRILGPIIQEMENQGITQGELAKRTGLSQPFISAVLNIRKRLSMEQIALFQNALGIVLQMPEIMSKEEHRNKYYSEMEYQPSTGSVSRVTCVHGSFNMIDSYSVRSKPSSNNYLSSFVKLKGSIVKSKKIESERSEFDSYMIGEYK